MLNDKLVKSCYNEINIDYNFYIISAKAESDQGLKKWFFIWMPQMFDFTPVSDIRLSLWLENPAEGATS